MVRSVFAGLAAAVVASQGQYVNERVAIHLSQQRARSGKRRHRRRARVYSAKGRRRQQEGAQAAQEVTEEVQAEQAVAGQVLGPVDQVGQVDGQSSVMSQSLDTQQVRGGTDSEGTSSNGVSNGSSQVDRLTKQNNQSRQPAESIVSQQRNCAEQEVTQLASDSDQPSVKHVQQPQPHSRLLDELAVDGQLLTFVMPEASPGTELRLQDDTSSLPVTVTVPQRACMGDVITGRVHEYLKPPRTILY